MIDPLYATPVTDLEVDAGDGAQVAAFIEAFLISTKTTVATEAGDPIELRDWQRHILGAIYARDGDGRRRHRTAYVGMPRKNGKSALVTGCALHGLFLGDPGDEVVCVAPSVDQARIVFETAKRCVVNDPELESKVRIWRDAIEVTETGSTMKVRASLSYTAEGLSPTLVIMDEVHALPNRELWDTMALGSAARPEPLMIGITTAGVRTDTTGRDSIGYELYQHLRAVAEGSIDDETFCGIWYGAPDTMPYAEEATWMAANPGLHGDPPILDIADFQATVKRTPESEFCRKRLNLWRADATSWFPEGVFEDLADVERVVADDDRVVLGFDGSFAKDATALVGCTVPSDPDDVPHVFVVDVWERPVDASPEWRVNVPVVLDAIRQECQHRNVAQVVADPWGWEHALQELTSEGLPMEAFPQSPARMVPATTTLEDLVGSGDLSHDGDGRLVRHVRNATIKPGPKGNQITKAAKNATATIDSAVAMIMAVATATALANEPEPVRGVSGVRGWV